MKHKKVKQSEYYKAEGGKINRTRRLCNRCGDGTFMAEHKDRWYCGKCGMTVWKTKDETDQKAKQKTKQEDKAGTEDETTPLKKDQPETDLRQKPK